MYIETEDYQTIWNLSHNWVGQNPELTDPNNLSKDLQFVIQRLLAAIMRNNLPAKGKKLAIFSDDSIFTIVFDARHFYRIYKCIHNDIFNKSYLNSIYVRRANVIDWCKKEYIDLPPIWKLEDGKLPNVEVTYDSSDDENVGWYNDLTDQRKKKVVCLDIANKLWLIDPNQTYEEIYNHKTMKQFGNPTVFSFNAFKKWSRPFASEYAKVGGRRN